MVLQRRTDAERKRKVPASKENKPHQTQKDPANYENSIVIPVEYLTEGRGSESHGKKYRQYSQKEYKGHEEYSVSFSEDRGEIRRQENGDAARGKESCYPCDECRHERSAY